MTPLYDFLFFLQKQDGYYRRQDSILSVLAESSYRRPENLLIALQQIDPELFLQTQEKMHTEPMPFPNTSFRRLHYGQTDYPKEFTQLIDPPLVFSYLGEPIWKSEKIAIVGSRQPSQKSIWWLAKELKPILATTGLVSVSGGARGVDQLVHLASVDLKLPTLAILPSGLDQIYPQSFQMLQEPILKNGGCLLSEFSDSETVKKYHFSHRNRLIAALGKVSMIVEAREKSGSLITAHRALEMGKDVFVVPGHPLDDSFRGSLSLLKLGAHILTDSNDIHYWI